MYVHESAVSRIYGCSGHRSSLSVRSQVVELGSGEFEIEIDLDTSAYNKKEGENPPAKGCPGAEHRAVN